MNKAKLTAYTNYSVRTSLLRKHLAEQGIEYEEINVEDNPNALEFLQARGRGDISRYLLPQFYVGQHLVWEDGYHTIFNLTSEQINQRIEEIMLINKSYERDQIVSFKLVNGDEIVAKIIEDTDSAFVVSKPTTVIPSPQGMGLLQSLYTSDLNNSVTIQKSHVMFHATTIDQVQKHYIQTTTGIEPVSAGGIIT